MHKISQEEGQKVCTLKTEEDLTGKGDQGTTTAIKEGVEVMIEEDPSRDQSSELRLVGSMEMKITGNETAHSATVRIIADPQHLQTLP